MREGELLNTLCMAKLGKGKMLVCFWKPQRDAITSRVHCGLGDEQFPIEVEFEFVALGPEWYMSLILYSIAVLACLTR